MTIDLIVIGAGGFGRETLDVVEAVNAAAAKHTFRVLGVADDHPSAANLQRIDRRGYRHLGTVEAATIAFPGATYVLGIGHPGIKREIAKQLDGAGWSGAVVIHPGASVGSETRIAEGTVVCGGVQVSTNVALGRHVHLNPSATIGHDTRIGDFTSVNPGAIISGEVEVGEGVLIGAASVVLQGLSIASGATVGASACVTRSVESADVVVGIPARPLAGGHA